MKLVGRVVDERDRALASAPVQLLSIDDGTPTPCGQGRVSRGRLAATLSAPVTSWGLLIGGKPVLALAVSARAGALDLGEIVLLDTPRELAVFPAVDGLVHGMPRALLAVPVPAAPKPRDTAPASLESTLAPTMSFSTLLGSAARQLRVSVAQDEGLTLRSASVNIKGLPTTTDDALALTFPTAAEIASGGAGLSSLAFQLDPKSGSAPPPPPPEARLPLLVGYTRELALRKLAAAGWSAQVQQEIVADPGLAGRVVRQFPAAETAHPAGALVGLFVGKEAAA
jgi:hypothetical protein